MKKLNDGELMDMTPEEVAAMQPSIDALAAGKLADIAKWRDEQEQGVVGYMGYVWQGDPTSRDRINTTLLSCAATRTLPPGFFWTSFDNTDVPVSYDDLEGLLRIIVGQGFSIHSRQRQMKGEIAALVAAGDRDGVANYTVGWPA